MTCRHSPGDPDCSSNRRYVNPVYSDSPTTPDKRNYEIVDVLGTDKCLILKVKYPNCYRCEYEGIKILVFKDTKVLDALKWKEIDPHFRASNYSLNAAPSPIARFPNSKDGWNHAWAFAKYIDSGH